VIAFELQLIPMDKMCAYCDQVAALWAFDGWADLGFLAEEVINPERVLPLVMLSGVATATVCYILTNVAYLVNDRSCCTNILVAR